MTKESSSKKQTQKSPKCPPVQQKPSFKPKKKGTEIDEIFAGKKRKQPENDKKVDTKKLVKVSSSNVKSHEWSRVIKKDNIRASKDSPPRPRKNTASGRPRKKTADGLTIYTEEELGYGKPDAGGTPLCPFDCDCCF